MDAMIPLILHTKMEEAIFPNDLHFKVAFTGCSNDCCKVRMHDFGIIGMTLPQLTRIAVSGCGACTEGMSEKVSRSTVKC